MAIFTFPRKPTANEDPHNVRKDMVAGTTRDGKVTYFVRHVTKGSRYFDRCTDIISDMETNDARARRERQIERAVQLLEGEGARVTWSRRGDERPAVRISEEEARATEERAWRAERR